MPALRANDEAVAAGLRLMRERDISPEEASDELAARGLRVSASTLRRRAAELELEDDDESDDEPRQFMPYGWHRLECEADELGEVREVALHALVDRLLDGGGGDDQHPDEAVTATEFVRLARATPPSDRWFVARLLRALAGEPDEA